jgi:hypothetical protein
MSNRGNFLWYELMSNNLAGAKAFYGELLGWGLQPWQDSPTEYSMFTVKGRAVAGLMELPADAKKMGAKPHWMAYVGSNDVDATTSQARQLGAKVVVPPSDIPKVGRWSLLEDPQGAMLSPFKSTDPEMPSQPPEIGDFSWHELATTDVDAAWRFYESLYGWKHTQTMDMGDMGPYLLFMASEHQGGGIYKLPPEMKAPPHWLFYVRVDNIDDAVKRCSKLKGKVLNGPMEVPGGDRVAMCLDPEGTAFAMHALKKG